MEDTIDLRSRRIQTVVPLPRSRSDGDCPPDGGRGPGIDEQVIHRIVTTVRERAAAAERAKIERERVVYRLD